MNDIILIDIKNKTPHNKLQFKREKWIKLNWWTDLINKISIWDWISLCHHKQAQMQHNIITTIIMIKVNQTKRWCRRRERRGRRWRRRWSTWPSSLARTNAAPSLSSPRSPNSLPRSLYAIFLFSFLFSSFLCIFSLFFFGLIGNPKKTSCISSRRNVSWLLARTSQRLMAALLRTITLTRCVFIIQYEQKEKEETGKIKKKDPKKKEPNIKQDDSIEDFTEDSRDDSSTKSDKRASISLGKASSSAPSTPDKPRDSKRDSVSNLGIFS